MAGLTIRELVTRLGFDIDDEKLDTFERRVSRVKVGLISLTAVAAAGAVGLAALIRSAGETGEQLQASSELVGLSVETYQEYALAANLAEVSTEEFQTALQFLNRNVGNAIAGNKELTKTFAKLGLSVADLKRLNTAELLEKLHGRFAAIESPAERAALSVALFGRSGLRMGRFLSQSQEQFEETTRIIRMFGFYTAELAAKGDEMGDRWALVGTLFKGIRNEIGQRFFEAATRAANAVLKWVEANEALIHSKIDSFVAMVTRGAGMLWAVLRRVAGAAAFLVKVMGGLENVVRLVGVAIAAIFSASVVSAIMAMIALFTALSVAARIALLQIFVLPALIAAGIFALILAIEDLYTWIQGGDSVIGDWLGEWSTFKAKALEEMGAFLDGLKLIWSGIENLFKGVWDLLAADWQALVALWHGDLDGFTAALKRFAKGWGEILQAPIDLFFGLVESVAAGMYKLAEGSVRIIAGLVEKAIPPGLVKLANWITDKVGAAGSALASGPSVSGEPLFAGVGPGMPMPSFGGLARPAATAGATKTELNVNANVTVPPGTSEQQAAFMQKSMEEIAEQVFGRHLDHAMQNNPRQQ